jgi:hypothetical protein
MVSVGTHISGSLGICRRSRPAICPGRVAPSKIARAHHLGTTYIYLQGIDPEEIIIACAAAGRR